MHMNTYQPPVAITSAGLSEQRENIAFSKIIEIDKPLPPLPLLVRACAGSYVPVYVWMHSPVLS